MKRKPSARPSARPAARTGSRRGRALVVRLTLLAVLTLGCGLEVWMRVATERDGGVPPIADESLREEWQWAARHLAAGVPRLESDWQPDPLLGWRLLPGLRRDGLTTNSAGLRGTQEFAQPKPEGVLRVLVLGDSYSFGQDVRDEESFPARLQALLPAGAEVLNLAVPGYGTDQQVLLGETQGYAYTPDVVILGFFVRDLSRNVLSFRSFAKPRFVLDEAASDGSGLRLLGPPLPTPEALFEDYRSGRRRIGAGVRSYAVAALQRTASRLSARSLDEESESWRLLAQLMQRFQSGVRASGAEPVWLILPDRDGLSDEDEDQLRLIAFCEARAASLGLSCLSMRAPFQAAAPAASPFDDRARGGHLSPAGHEIVARELQALLLSRSGGKRPRRSAKSR
ncbi:MAG: SGNH/GDSL hydrolase family protein [Planctomycetota bacterium]